MAYWGVAPFSAISENKESFCKFVLLDIESLSGNKKVHVTQCCHMYIYMYTDTLCNVQFAVYM